jgi:dTMP kinase
VTRARFIAFDGGEGCGKSTQIAMLHRVLQLDGVDAITVRDPGTTRVGELVRAILLNPDHDELALRCEMLLYMSARAQMMSEVIAPALARGTTVLSDRFVSSTLAYQLGGEDLTEEEIRAVAAIALRGRWPDLTLILDMPAERSIARVSRAKDRIEQRPIDYHRVVRENFLRQARRDPMRHRVIDADRPGEIVHADVLSIVRSMR